MRGRYPLVNMLGQPVTPAARQHLPCPTVPPPDPKLNCAKTRDGGVICSDGKYYPPYCASPPVTEEAVALYERQGAFMFPKPPPELSLTAEVGGGFPWFALGLAVAGGVASVVFS